MQFVIEAFLRYTYSPTDMPNFRALQIIMLNFFETWYGRGPDLEEQSSWCWG